LALEMEPHEKLVQYFLQTEGPFTELADLSTKKRTIRAIEIHAYLSENPMPETVKSVPFKPILFGIDLPREVRRARIAERLLRRLDAGLIHEIEGLLQQGVSAESLTAYGLEYKFSVMYLQKQISQQELVAQLTTAIQQYSKRQMTWFRKMERDGTVIHWIDGMQSIDQQLSQILTIYHAWPL
jgi:tRNA dimethylallyltransferase